MPEKHFLSLIRMNSKVKTILKLFVILILISGFAAYGLYRSRSILSGPSIEISSPVTGGSASNPMVEVKGKVQNVAAVFLNGNQIFTNEDGEFKESLLLAGGYNIIVVNAKDKFGREAKQIREVFINN